MTVEPLLPPLSRQRRGRGTAGRRAGGGGGKPSTLQNPRPLRHPLFGGRSPSPAAQGRKLFALVFAFFAIVLVTAAHAAPKFPPLTGRVVDLANILSPEAEQKLSAQSAELEAQTHHQFVVATVPDLQGYEIEDFGYQLLRTWGIGRKDEDDGVILLVAPNQRAVRIEVGYGLEPVMTDALSSVILQERVLPRFREGQMEAGVVAGADAVVQQLRLPEGEAKARVAQAAQAQAQPEGLDFGTVIVAFVMLWVIISVLGGRGGWWILPLILSGGRGGGGFGGGGFSGGGGSGGGGGATGRW